MRNFSNKNLKKGQAMITAVIFFLFISMTTILGVTGPVYKEVQLAEDIKNSKASFYLSESGQEDVIYRIKNGISVSNTESLTIGSSTVTTTILDNFGVKIITSSATTSSLVRRVETILQIGEGASFNYGVQSGQGGFVLENSASITGNVYSSGSIVGVGNTIYGDAISAGPTGLIDDIHTTGSAYAHTIRDSDVDVNAYYATSTNNTIGGTSYGSSTDQSIIGLPISDEQISELEADALAGGVISSPCPYKINSDQTLGPIKITCNLEISGNPTVTLGGSVWVTGSVLVQNTAILRVSSSLGNRSVAIIADKPTDRVSGSDITLKNSSQFFGSGSANSFVFFISQNNSAELGGTNSAISMDNTSDGRSVVLYAAHGLIDIQNSATLKEVTAYKIKAKNSANIVYDSGLANTLFTSGPGGGYEILDWKEVP